MSMTTDPTDPQTLTDDERDVFERLADEYEDDTLGRICELVLQSDSREETNS